MTPWPRIRMLWRSDVWRLWRWVVSKARGDGEYRIVRFVTVDPPPFDFSELEDDDD